MWRVYFAAWLSADGDGRLTCGAVGDVATYTVWCLSDVGTRERHMRGANGSNKRQLEVRGVRVVITTKHYGVRSWSNSRTERRHVGIDR